jgi:hypothetical protein
MTNILKFEIETDAYYSDKEKLDLLEEFLGFIRGIDDEVIEDSEKFSVVDKDDATPEVPDSVKNEIVREFLDNAAFETKLTIANGGVGFAHVMK